MKRIVFLCMAVMAFGSCSIKKMAFNSIANMMAPLPETLVTLPPDASSPADALTEEEDVQLVSAVFPTVIKVYEMMYRQNPHHRGLALMLGQLYIMYANAFVEGPANYLGNDVFDLKQREQERASMFYLRGHDYVLKGLDLRYPHFSESLKAGDSEAFQKMLDGCVASDVPSLYWAGAGFLGAFAINPFDAQLTEAVAPSVAMLERASQLNPSFNDGAIWAVLTKFYASVPDLLGGGMDKAEYAFSQYERYAGKNNADVYVTYAESFCIPTQDSAGFDANLAKALAIDPKKQPKNKLMAVLAYQRAKWLKNHKDDYFLE